MSGAGSQSSALRPFAARDDARSWSTEDAASADRVGYWRQAISEGLLELDFEAKVSGFEARLKQYPLGSVALSIVSINSAHRVIRTSDQISRNTVPRLNLNCIRSGSWTVDHYGRTVTIQAGEMILLDPREPYCVTSTNGAQHYCVHLPLDWLRCWLPAPEAVVASPIRLGTPWRAALAATIEETALGAAVMSRGTRELCAAQIAGALALAFGPARSDNTTHARAIYLRILGVIADMAADNELDAPRVANALSISPRYMHKILARENTSYSVELVRIRTERAYALLHDGRFRDLSTSEIGWRCGFCDPSHFIKRFRIAFGKTPGAMRRDLVRANFYAMQSCSDLAYEPGQRK